MARRDTFFLWSLSVRLFSTLLCTQLNIQYRRSWHYITFKATPPICICEYGTLCVCEAQTLAHTDIHGSCVCRSWQKRWNASYVEWITAAHMPWVWAGENVYHFICYTYTIIARSNRPHIIYMNVDNRLMQILSVLILPCYFSGNENWFFGSVDFSRIP